MNVTKLKVMAATVVVVALVTLVVWQQWRAKRLMAEADILREQVGQLDAAREERERLVEQLRLASERSKADASELARLRGQSVRLRQVEQEIAKLKAEHDRSANRPLSSSPTVAIQETPESGLVRARMNYSKILGLCLLMFASDHQGQVPANVQTAISALKEGEFNAMLADQLPPDSSTYDLRAEHFEVVYQGNVDATGRPTGSTIILRTRDPVQLSNGRWARACAFDDGHSEVIVADTPAELAAKEKRFMQAQADQ